MTTVRSPILASRRNRQILRLAPREKSKDELAPETLAEIESCKTALNSKVKGKAWQWRR